MAASAPLPPSGGRSQRSDQETKALRRRLVEALALAIEERGAEGGGYSSVTVADVVRHAQTSKRSFYELFDDKDDCLLAAYRGLSEFTIRGVEAAFVHAAPEDVGDGAHRPRVPFGWVDRMHAAANAYVATLALRPILTRTFLLEIHTAGGPALEVRRSVHHRFATLLERLVDLAREENPDLEPLARPMAIALVGGINELVLDALEAHRNAKLAGVADAVTELVRRVVLLPA